ncbi:MAG TPA: hypothetical protein VD928_01050 [Candidatus Paceibacterota bacterium]|nr:hypothetical protein [Candidatus Paceibacterota bacterium]
MYIIFEHITTVRDKAWAWFVARAHGPYAFFWLCLLSFLEPFISPIVPEALMVAMILARREYWKQYAAITIVFTFLGGLTGYFLGAFLFREVEALLAPIAGFQEFQDVSNVILGGNIFLVMFFIAFTLLPDKPFTYLSGFLGAPVLYYAGGLLVGRSMRVILTAYLAYRFGPQILAALNKYFFWFAIIVLAIFAIYVTLQLNLVPGIR